MTPVLAASRFPADPSPPIARSDTPLPADARWTSGPSLDGKGEFVLREPAPAFGHEPELQPAPPEVHAGVEATGTGKSVFGRFTRGLGKAVDKVTPGDS